MDQILNVRDGNERRKRALAKLMQKMMQAGAGGRGGAGAAGGLAGGAARSARGPVITQRAFPLGRVSQAFGNRGPLIGAMGRFGMVDRQPGANDPGAGYGGGGISTASPAQSVTTGLPAPAGGGSGDPRFDPNAPTNQGGTTLEDYAAQRQASGGTGAEIYLGGTSDYSGVNDVLGGSAPAAPQSPTGGYVMYQGQLVPRGVYNALMRSGGI